MNRSFNYITFDNPNIPVLLPADLTEKPIGQFTMSPANVRNEYESSIVQVNTRDMYLPNFSLREFKGVVTRDAVFKNHEGEGAGLPGSCIFFKAKMKSYRYGSKDELWSHTRTHNFKYDPSNEFEHWVPADHPFHFIHLSYSTNYLSQLLPEDEPWAEKLKSRVMRRERIIGDQSLPISLLQEQALHTIYNCPLTGKLGEMMIESAIYQVVLLQLYSLFNSSEGSHPNGISKRDAAIISEVREYLTSNFLEDHSMQCLSRHFGTNTNKLTGLFRRMFGQSIFEYITDRRMEHARQLLKERDLRVVDIARTLGYKNPNHFSTAFKRKFGVVPTEVR